MVTVNRTSLVKIGMSFYPSGRYSLNQGRKNSSWGRKGNVIPKWLEVIRDCLECEHPTKVGTNCSSCGDFFEDFSKTRKACHTMQWHLNKFRQRSQTVANSFTRVKMYIRVQTWNYIHFKAEIKYHKTNCHWFFPQISLNVFSFIMLSYFTGPASAWCCVWACH